MLRGFLSSLALLFPLAASATTMVGNPGVILIIDGGSDWTADAAWVDIDFVRVHDCEEGYVDTTVDDDIDLADGLGVPGPEGDVCGVTLYTNSTLEIDATGPGSESWSWELAVNGVRTADIGAQSGDPQTWILGTAEGSEVVDIADNAGPVTPAHGLHDELRDTIWVPVVD